jgi:hypothetical protein
MIIKMAPRPIIDLPIGSYAYVVKSDVPHLPENTIILLMGIQKSTLDIGKTINVWFYIIRPVTIDGAYIKELVSPRDTELKNVYCSLVVQQNFELSRTEKAKQEDRRIKEILTEAFEDNSLDYRKSRSINHVWGN